MPDNLDLQTFYRDWLEIPEERLPPNHYALLGVADFEDRLDVIEDAAKTRGAYLHQIASGPQRKIVQELLRQVAVARRTLLTEATRRDYDRSLRDGSALPASTADETLEPVNDGANEPTSPAEQVDRHDDSEPSTAAPASTAKRQRKRPSVWKYHAISAAVLLAIVGAIYLYNRGPSGRRAAEVGPARRSSPIKQPAKDREADGVGLNRQRRSPIAEPREQGSGLGMAEDSRFADVLSEVNANSTRQSSAGTSESKSEHDGFQPLGGIEIDDQILQTQSPPVFDSLRPIDGFPKSVPPRYDEDGSANWLVPKGDRLLVDLKTAKGTHHLIDNAFQLSVGNTVSVGVSASAELPAGMQIGFVIDGIVVSLELEKANAVLFVLDRGENVAAQGICETELAGNQFRMTISRDAKDAESLRWILTDQKRTLQGKLRIIGFAETPLTGLHFKFPDVSGDAELAIREIRTTR